MTRLIVLISLPKKSTMKVRFVNLTKNNEEKIRCGRNPKNPWRGKTGKQNDTEQTYYRWRSKYEGMNFKEVLRMKQLEEENRRLKQIIADQVQGISIPKEIPSKKW